MEQRVYFCRTFNPFSMYAYLKGEITYRTPAFLTLEVNGVGYHLNIPLSTYRSEERRVGKECRSRWSPYH